MVQRHVGMLNAIITEQEMRALAGLPVQASIEEVDRGQPARLENAAQATQFVTEAVEALMVLGCDVQAQ